MIFLVIITGIILLVLYSLFTALDTVADDNVFATPFKLIATIILAITLIFFIRLEM